MGASHLTMESPDGCHPTGAGEPDGPPEHTEQNEGGYENDNAHPENQN